MAKKELLFSEQAREALMRGASVVAEAVRVTLGPRGRNVVIERKWGSPIVTKDGVTVAKEIELEDREEDMGAQLLKEIASKTNDLAGWTWRNNRRAASAGLRSRSLGGRGRLPVTTDSANSVP